MTTYKIDPVAKPRMTQRDKWKQRPAVLKYRAFCDHVRLLGISVPDQGCHVTFVIPMAASWSKKKKDFLRGQPHQQRPDVDNLTKALMDAVHKEDCSVWDIRTTKIWGDAGAILIDQMQEAA
jgi:Holliday junction resolvase RusA-like endonuclease